MNNCGICRQELKRYTNPMDGYVLTGEIYEPMKICFICYMKENVHFTFFRRCFSSIEPFADPIKYDFGKCKFCPVCKTSKHNFDKLIYPKLVESSKQKVKIMLLCLAYLKRQNNGFDFDTVFIEILDHISENFEF